MVARELPTATSVSDEVEVTKNIASEYMSYIVGRDKRAPSAIY